MNDWFRQIINRTAQKTPNAYFVNIEKETLNNTDYRRVLFTAENSQLVLMSLQPGEEIGTEIHDLDQFFRFEKGEGKVVINGVDHSVYDGDAVVIPQGTKHNIVNTSPTKDLKLYSIYSPPNHKKDTIHKTKNDETEEHFDGQTDLNYDS